MTIAERLNAAEAAPGHDSRCVPIFVDDDYIATSGEPQMPGCEHYSIQDVTTKEVAGHWITIVHGTDETSCWWHENNENWAEGLPTD
jgi:hypothetical protein